MFLSFVGFYVSAPETCVSARETYVSRPETYVSRAETTFVRLQKYIFYSTPPHKLAGIE
jgi:hypothetical protein